MIPTHPNLPVFEGWCATQFLGPMVMWHRIHGQPRGGFRDAEQEEERHQKEKKRLINEAYNAADWSVSTPRLQLLLQKEERCHQEILKQLASK
jgi:hypothetical protein